MLKIFENFENYDARHFLWEITNEARTSFPIKIQGHLLSCLWSANLKEWVSDKGTYWAVCWQLKSEQKGVYQRKCIVHSSL